MLPIDRARAILRNRAAYGLPPLSPADIAARGARRRPRQATIIEELPMTPGRQAYFEMIGAVHGKAATSLNSAPPPAPPPPRIKLVAGIPAVAIGARLPGERRQKRRTP